MTFAHILPPNQIMKQKYTLQTAAKVKYLCHAHLILW